MSHRVFLTLILAAFAVAACDGDDDGTAPAPPTTTAPAPEQASPERRGVVLSLDPESPHAGETLTLTVENHTRLRLEYGLVYRLEHRTEGRWRWINRNAAFALILKLVEPGKREQEEIRLDTDLGPGRYRIVKSFTASAADKRLSASVEFIVSAA